MSDNISSPSHYIDGRTIEPIEVIIDWDLDGLEANVLKYLSRWRRKGNPLGDLRKMHAYVHYLIQREQRRVGK